MRIVQKIDYIVGKRVRIFVVLYYNAVDIVFEYNRKPKRKVEIVDEKPHIKVNIYLEADILSIQSELITKALKK